MKYTLFVYPALFVGIASAAVIGFSSDDVKHEAVTVSDSRSPDSPGSHLRPTHVVPAAPVPGMVLDIAEPSMAPEPDSDELAETMVAQDDEPIRDVTEGFRYSESIIQDETEAESHTPVVVDNRQTSGERVIDISISGGTVVASSQDEVLWKSAATARDEAGDTLDKTGETASGDNQPPAYQPQRNGQSTEQFECPDSLYMGGNSYAVAILKRAGCPKPSNYDGAW
jgi:hypothetical protein